jgi:pyruvate, orthophosphate dikinase
MPGMMNTILNIGLTDEVVEGMIKLTGNPRFVWDSYRRLVEMFGTTVFNLDDEVFEDPLKEYKDKRGYKLDTEMTAEDWKALVAVYKKLHKQHAGVEFPQEVFKQMELATKAVFESWNGKKAIDYRKATNISDDLGTAVNIVTMVFGNMGDDSGTGVAFTRNPSTGEKKIMGEYLLNAQGEDVVSGIRNTEQFETLSCTMPDVYNQFLDITGKLEKHFKDMQDIEFTIERGRLWMLQTRNAKRTSHAAIKIAVDLANEGLISREEAVIRISPQDVDTELKPQLIIKDKAYFDENKCIAKGMGISSGIASGKVYFDADIAEKAAGEYGEDVILIQPFYKAEDVHGMLASKGVISIEGGSTSQAALVARQFNIPCIIGVKELHIDLNNHKMNAGDLTIQEGELISFDCSKGNLYLGKINQVRSAPMKPLDRFSLESGNIEENVPLQTLLSWADTTISLKKIGFRVWANADYPKDVLRARSYGAVGIGLSRTEHMFFGTERLPIFQRLILAKSNEERKASLDKLLHYLKRDFEDMFKAIDGYPIVIRLLDPPLHEFMPDQEKFNEEVITMRIKGEIEGLKEKENMLAVIKGMYESNPMMGLRGVRLYIAMPEIIEMQVRAIFEAAATCALRGIVVKPELLIPMVSTAKELEWILPRLDSVATAVIEENNVSFAYKFGVMIETPRAALIAADIAQYVQFFSFGTNDLTQMTFGYSRDDVERNFLGQYVAEGILPKNPFQTLDRDGVGKFMEWAVYEGRKSRSDLEVGICGEHAGDPDSIEFCFRLRLNQISCSPYRVPIARLSAAHAVLKHKKQ